MVATVKNTGSGISLDIYYIQYIEIRSDIFPLVVGGAIPLHMMETKNFNVSESGQYILSHL